MFFSSYNLSGIDTYEDIISSGIPFDEISLIYRWLVYQTNDPSFSATRRRSFGFSLDEFIVEAAFALTPFNTTTDFEWYYDYFYGNCFRYNMNQSRTLDLQEAGLEITLFAGLADDHYDYLYASQSNGLRVFIADRNYIPLSSEGILVRPGEHVNIELSKSLVSIKPKPYSKCIEFDSNYNELTRAMSKLNISYTRKDCLYVCFQKLSVEAFGCYDLQYPKIVDDSVEPCANFSSFKKTKVSFRI